MADGVLRIGGEIYNIDDGTVRDGNQIVGELNSQGEFIPSGEGIIPDEFPGGNDANSKERAG